MKHWLLLLMVIPGVLFAGSYQLDTLLEQGMQKSARIQQKQLDLKDAESSLRSAYLDFLPTANLSWNSEWQDSNRSDTKTIGVSKSLSLSEPTWFNLKRSQTAKTSAELTYQNEVKQYVYDVFAAYVSILETQKNIGIQEDNLQVQQKIWDDTRSQFQQGRKSVFELNQAEISFTDTKIELENLQNQLADQRASLFRLVNTTDDGSPLLDTNLPTPVDSVAVMNMTKQPKYENVFSMRILDLSLQKVGYTLQQEKLRFLPDVTVSYSWSKAYDKSNDITYPYDNSGSIGLTASYNIWNIFQHGEEWGQQKNQYKRLLISKDDSAAQLVSDYQKAQRDLLYLTKTYELYNKKLIQAQSNLDIAQERYRLGLINLIDLEQARVEQLNAELSRNSKYYSLIKKQEEVNLLLSQPVLGRW